MKKRVSSSEISRARNSSRILFLTFFIIFLVLFLGFGLLTILDVDLLSFLSFPRTVQKSSPVSDSKVNVEKEESYADLDISDSSIQNYFRYVHITGKNVCQDGGYLDQEEVLVGKMKEECKYSLASNLYEKDVQSGLDGVYSIPEEDVKNAYQTLFGKGTYTPQESIPCFGNSTFIRNGDYYFTKSLSPEEDGSLVSYEKLLKATRNGDELQITSAVLYYEKVQSVFCKDRKCEQVLETVKSGSEFDQAFFDLYVEHYQEKLYQYTYQFEMDEAGFYRYVGYQRTNG